VKKQFVKNIDENLTIYRTEQGMLISQGVTYITMVIFFFGALMSLIAAGLLISKDDYLPGFICGSACCLFLIVFFIKKELEFEVQNKKYSFRFLLFNKIIRNKEGNYTEHLFSLYDSSNDWPPRIGYDKNTIYQLRLMTANGFIKVFTFNEKKTAYGFRDFIIKQNKEFKFEAMPQRKTLRDIIGL